MPSEYVKVTYPRLLSQYNEYYKPREQELSSQLTKLDSYDEFGRLVKKERKNFHMDETVTEEKWKPDKNEKRKRTKRKKGFFYDNNAEEIFNCEIKHKDKKLKINSDIDYNDAFNGSFFLHFF